MYFSLLPFLFAALPFASANPRVPTIPKNATLPKHFGILLYNGFTELDVYGPLGVLQGLYAQFLHPNLHLSIISKNIMPVSSVPGLRGDFGESVVVTSTFGSILAQNGTVPGKGPLEVLLVPGGAGSRNELEEEVTFIKAIYPKLKHIMSVCTGSTLLARSGILDGRKATTNKKAWAWATSTGPKVDWVHTARWVPDGNIWTSSGVSAGIDLTYAWVGNVYGEDVADYIAQAIEYKRWYNATDDPFAAVWNEPEP